MRGWKRTFHTTGKETANVAFLISDAIDFNMEDIETDKNGHYMIKGAIN